MELEICTSKRSWGTSWSLGTLVWAKFQKFKWPGDCPRRWSAHYTCTQVTYLACFEIGHVYEMVTCDRAFLFRGGGGGSAKVRRLSRCHNYLRSPVKKNAWSQVNEMVASEILLSFVHDYVKNGRKMPVWFRLGKSAATQVQSAL